MSSCVVPRIALAIAFQFTLASAHAANSGFQTAELLSITSGRGLDNVATHRWAIFTVQAGDVIYTASGKRIRHPADDYSEGFSAGDTVQAAISGNELVLRKPSGGELKMKIVKRARAQ
jgi:hypothetical protein